MPSRPSRAARPARPRPANTGAAPCPCGGPGSYDACCGRLHRAEASAASPEELMRSRYSAFAVHDEAYLLRTWHPTTRPASIEPDPALRWLRLEILARTGGGPFHTEGTVEFRAHYRDAGHPGSLHETSRFTHHGGAWLYLDGTIAAD